MVYDVILVLILASCVSSSNIPFAVNVKILVVVVNSINTLFDPMVANQPLPLIIFGVPPVLPTNAVGMTPPAI